MVNGTEKKKQNFCQHFTHIVAIGMIGHSLGFF